MKKTMIALVALSGVALAGDLTYIATFANGAAPSWSDLNMNYNKVDVTNHTDSFTDGTTLTYNQVSTNGGKTWNDVAVSYTTWTNAAALEDLSTTMGKTIDSLAGLNLLYCAGAASYENLILTLGKNANEGDAVTIYTLVAKSTANDINSFSVDGLNNAEITYAKEDGDGFSSDQAFSTGAGHGTLVKITGTLTDAKAVTFGSPSVLKAGYGLMAAKVVSTVVPEPATATLSLLALAGLAARRRRH